MAETAPSRLCTEEPPDPATLAILNELEAACRELEAADAEGCMLTPALRAFNRISEALARPICIVVLGEFNSGKSALVNLLTGIDSLPTAVIPNTRLPTIVSYADEPKVSVLHAAGAREILDTDDDFDESDLRHIEVGLPIPALRHLRLVDPPSTTRLGVPGTNDLLKTYRPDILIWCTVATQAWKASERAVWLTLSERFRQHTLLAATHADLLRDGANLERLRGRLTEEAGGLFGGIVMVGLTDTRLESDDIEPGGSRQSSGAPGLVAALNLLIANRREERLRRAWASVGRISGRALAGL